MQIYAASSTETQHERPPAFRADGAELPCARGGRRFLEKRSSFTALTVRADLQMASMVRTFAVPSSPEDARFFDNLSKTNLPVFAPTA